MSWGRLQTLLEAAIIEADPVGAEQQAAAAAQERFVRLGRSSEHGLKLIIARATAGDAIWFKATIDRIADILAQQGDTDPVEVRRSKAIGILAQPAQALATALPASTRRLGRTRRTRRCCDRRRADDADDERRFAERSTMLNQPTTRRPLPALASPAAAPTSQRGSGHPSVAAASHRRRSTRTGPGPAPSSMSISAKKPSRAGSGVARVEDVGPVLLSRLRTLLGEHCSISLKPVIDLPAGHTPGRQLRDPGPAPRTTAAPLSRRRVPLRRRGEPPHRP